MKRIIVEGMDSTGKSTLIEKLQYEFHCRVVINELGPEQDFDYWWPLALSPKEWIPPGTIHDRFFYSEIVYGTVLRGYVRATKATQRAVSTVLRENALLIYARPDDYTIARTLSNKPQMEGVIERSDRLLSFYDDLMAREQAFYGPRFMKYDWRGDERAAVQLVERYLQGELWNDTTKTSTSST